MSINPIILFTSVMLSFPASAALITKQSTESYCASDKKESISWGLAFDYTDSPMVIEMKFINKTMIDTKLITLQDIVLPFTERITSSSDSTKILHEYAISMEDKSLDKLITSDAMLILHNVDGHKMLPISDDFIMCIKSQIGK